MNCFFWSLLRCWWGLWLVRSLCMLGSCVDTHSYSCFWLQEMLLSVLLSNREFALLRWWCRWGWHCLYTCFGTINHAPFFIYSTDIMWERDPSLGEPPGLLQLVHPLPPELPPQGMADPSSPAEPHQPWPPQGGTRGHNGWGVPLHLCSPLSLRHITNL